MNRIAVLIPCYNESLTIEKVVKDYQQALPDSDIYVYDNNSTDNTDVIARKAGAIVRYEYRQGKGNVIRSMFRDIEADCYLIIDGDDLFIEFLIKFVFSSPKDLILFSLFISFSFILITFDKQSPLTSISLPNETKPTFTLGECSSNVLILFSIANFTKSNLLT